MTSAQTERAVIMLYEDTSLREELFDEEADLLLKWGEAQAERLAALDMNDDQFDSAIDALYRAIRTINRFIPVRGDMPPEQQKATLDTIRAAAQEFAGFIPSAFSISAEKVDDFLQENATLDNIAAITTLTSLLAPTGADPGTSAPETRPAASPPNLLTSLTSALGSFAAGLQRPPEKTPEDPDDPENQG